MATLRVQQLTSVYSATSECDQLGTAAFLQKYDCGIPKKFWIDHNDKKFQRRQSSMWRIVSNTQKISVSVAGLSAAKRRCHQR